MIKNFTKLSATFLAVCIVAGQAGMIHPALALLAILGGTCAINIIAKGCKND